MKDAREDRSMVPFFSFDFLHPEEFKRSLQGPFKISVISGLMQLRADVD